VEKARFAAALVVMCLFAVACGAPATESAETTSASQPGATDVPVETTAQTTETQSPTTSAAVEAPSTTVSDRMVAPDFTLELGTGGSYTLSDGDKPVYMVFWAEW
jgi:hypothetical protein